MSREGNLTSHLIRSMKTRGAFAHKIADMPHVARAATSFDIKKPFDIVGCMCGVPFAIEAKAMDNYKPFGMRFMRKNQVQGLEDWARAGGAAYVVLFVQREASARKGQTRINRVLWWPWETFRDKGTFTRAELVLEPYVEYKNGEYPIDSFLLDISISGC